MHPYYPLLSLYHHFYAHRSWFQPCRMREVWWCVEGLCAQPIFLVSGLGLLRQHGDRSSYLWNTILFSDQHPFFLCKQKGTLYTGFGTDPLIGLAWCQECYGGIHMFCWGWSLRCLAHGQRSHRCFCAVLIIKPTLECTNVNTTYSVCVYIYIHRV